jgi:hypothetical protein
MPHIRTKDIDGIAIVVGFSSPGIDPEETRRAIQQRAINSPAGQKLSKIVRQIDTVATRRAELSKGRAKRVAINQCTAEIKRYKVMLEAAMNEVKQVTHSIAQDTVILLRGPGYHEVDDKTHKTLRSLYQALGPAQMLTADGQTITDRRKEELFYKSDGEWAVKRIATLGEDIPAGAKTRDELTNEEIADIIDQKKRARIEAMSTTERQKQLAKALEAIALQAATVRSAYEIEGRDNPLDDARLWYEAEKKRVEEVFDVSG